MGVWEHDTRKEEHRILEVLIRDENESLKEKMDLVICTGKLNLFALTLPKGQPIGWQDIPQEFWPCMPKNLIGQQKSIH